jgi:hypothetical protein
MAYGTVNADVIGTSVAGSNLGAGNATRFKNRFINGNMAVDQRYAGAAISAATLASGGYTVDRWAYAATQSAKFSAQQNQGSVTPPVGFNNYLGLTSASAYSVLTTDLFTVRQYIESYNFADLGWGTANAKTITISAWVYSSLTGTFGGSFLNYAGTRSYPFTYTISSANTWTQISVTIAGDTSGTWVGASNAGAAFVSFGLGVGTTYSGTAGSWSGSQLYSATGATSVVGTSGATFYITGVQLEVGSSATGFEYNDYGNQLIQCQRYFETSYSTGTAVGSATSAGCYTSSAVYGVTTTSYILGQISFKVMKRTAPTIISYDYAGTINMCTRDNVAVGSSNGQSVAFQSTGASGTQVYSSGSYNATDINCNWTASAEL